MVDNSTALSATLMHVFACLLGWWEGEPNWCCSSKLRCGTLIKAMQDWGGGRGDSWLFSALDAQALTACVLNHDED